MTLLRILAFFLLSCGLSCPLFSEDDPRPIEPEVISLGRPVDFAKDVVPIFEASCTACHNEIIDEGKLSLEEVAGMLKGGGRGPAIVPGKPDESLLLSVASHRVEPIMPPPENDAEAKPLTPRELGIIRQWILEGADKGQGAAPAMIAWKTIPSQLQAIHSVALAPENRFVAIGRGNQLELCDLLLNQAVVRLTDPQLASLSSGNGPLYPHGAAHQDLVHAVAFHPQGDLLASAGYRVVKLWERAGLGEAAPLNLSNATAIALAPDRTTAVIATGREVKLVKLEGGEAISTRSFGSRPKLLAFSADGQTLATICEDHSLNIWKTGTDETPRVVALPGAALSFTFSEQRLVTAHDDGIVRIWSPEKNDAPEKELTGHTGPVHAVKSLPGQANLIVSAGEDGTARVWDINTGAQARSMSHGSSVSDIALSPDGGVVVTVGSDGAVRSWNANDGNKTGEIAGAILRRRSANKAAEILEWRKQLVAVSDQRVKEAEATLKDREAIAAKSQEAKTAADTALAEAKKANEEAEAALKTATEQLSAKPDDEALKKAADEATKKAAEAKAKLMPAEDSIRSLERALSLANDALTAAKQRLEVRQKEKSISEEAAKTAEAANTSATTEAAQAPAAQRVAFASDGLRFAVSYADGSLQTFSAKGEPLDFMAADGAELRFLDFLTTQAVLIATSSGEVKRLDVVGSWQYAATLGPPAESPTAIHESVFSDRVLTLAFSPDGTRLATGGGQPSRSGQIILWDVATRTPTQSLPDAHSDTVSSVVFSRDGQRLASAAADKFAKLFDTADGRFLRSFEGHTDQVLGVGFKADGTELATASSDLTVKIWDAETGEQRRTIPGFGKQVTSIRYVGLTSEIATSSGDKTVRLHRTNDGGLVRAFAGPADFVHAVAASDDGATVLAGGEEGVLFVWNGKNGELLYRIEPKSPSASTTAAN